MSTPLEDLLRGTLMTHGRISIDVYGDGRWTAAVAHWGNVGMTHHFGESHDNPADALRVALIEDERRVRDLRRRYDAAPKFGATEPAPVDPEGMCMICEGGGCDACQQECRYCNGTGHFYGDPELGPCGCDRTTAVVDFEDLLG